MTVEEIKALSIREVANRCGVDVDRKGFCCCPAHSEKTGSCKLYDRTNTWYCFGCHAHGDNIDFVKAALNCDFEEAFKFLGGTHGKMTASDRLRAYQAKKHAEARREAKEKAKAERTKAHQRINELRASAETMTPFSDEWCATVEEAERIKVQLGLYDD